MFAGRYSVLAATNLIRSDQMKEAERDQKYKCLGRGKVVGGMMTNMDENLLSKGLL